MKTPKPAPVNPGVKESTPAASSTKKVSTRHSQDAPKDADAANLSAVAPSARLARLHFGPPLLPGEKQYDYYQMLEWVSEAVQPGDVIEHILVKEIVDANLEIARCGN
jgi:hypothetical protein